MRNCLLSVIVTAWLSSETISSAGSFTTDFSNPNQSGFTLNGSPVIQNNRLLMTAQGVGGAEGSIVLDDLDAGAAIESFTAKFQLKFVSSSIPADGLAFCFGPEVTSTSDFPVEGIGSALCVEFDTYDNSDPDNVGIDVKLAGVEIATTPMLYSQLVDGQYDDVVIQLNRNGTLNLTWKGQIIYTNLLLPNWSPVNGQFAFGASTGYFDEECDLKNLTITTTQSGATIVPAITLQPPQTATILEVTPLTLSVGFDGSAPLTFQWNLNDTAIPGATTSILQIPEVPLSYNNGKITCTVGNASGSATSQPTVLTVLQDTNPPTIQSVVGSENFKFVTVTFSKIVQASTAQDLGNYSIQGLMINSATPADDQRTVLLTTSLQTLGSPYTLVINNIMDKTQAGNTIAPNSQKTFHAFSYVSGFMVYDIYENAGFNAGSGHLDDLKASFNDLVPTRTLVFSSADTPDWEYGGNYGSVSQGLIVAPETGSYIFHIASDDQSQLLLSTDDTPAHLTGPICQITTWDGHLDWAGKAKGSPDTSPTSGNVSRPIQLTQGQKYYFRAFHVEGTGPDGLSIGWELPSAPRTIVVIPGSNLMALMNTDVPMTPSLTINRTPSGIAITFTGSLQSADSVLGPWTNLPGSSPLPISPTAPMKFYRAKL
jgi:hypothetical protein